MADKINENIKKAAEKFEKEGPSGPKAKQPVPYSAKEKTIIKKLQEQALKKLPGPLGKIVGMTVNQIADKYTGRTMFRLFGELQNKKKIFGDKFEEVKKKLAKAKKLRTRQIEMGEVSDRLSENLPKASLRKSGGKIKKMQSGGRVGAPRGTGAALRGFGKGYK
jgi:hypothetical protein|tara:strand:+ start:861 stop:1352 length:492 start_codon:yes stop_codon:yes gene_type:complete